MKLRIFSLGLLSLQAFAGEMGPVIKTNPTPWVGTLSLGPAWVAPGNQQTLYLTNSIEKTYTSDNPLNRLMNSELFLGANKDLPYNFMAHVGFAGVLTSQAGLSGAIWDDSSPKFNNYLYGYHIQHSHFAIKAKVFKYLYASVLPWVSASAGIGFNRTNGYYNMPVIDEAVVNNNFANHTQTSFTYTLGAGLEKIIDAHWLVGLGYELSDWGSNHLNPAAGQTIGMGLNMKHFYTNGLMINLTYIT
jgi:opacity protein-like surface antigen